MHNNSYIEEFGVYLLEEKKSSLHTVECYLRDIRQFYEFCVSQNLSYFDRVTKTNIISYLLFLQKKGRATSTISRNLASIRGLFQYLLKNEIIKLDPTSTLETPKIEKRIPQTLSVEEVEFLLDMPDLSNNKGIRDKAILEVLYATGLRVTELIHLKIQDVNLEKKNISCCYEDNKRVIPIENMAIQFLSRYIVDCRKNIIGNIKQDVLFVNMQGSELTRQGLWKIIKYYTNKANITKSITPHMIRHSFALHMIEDGVDIHSVKELLGHTDISSTQVYLRASSYIDLK